MFEKIASSANYIKSFKDNIPKIAILLGSGLGQFLQKMTDKIEIPYSDIPFFPDSFAKGTYGVIVLGKINGHDIVVLSGRLHAYDGVPMCDVVYPIRTIAALGVEYLFLTCGAGGINSELAPGDLVSISDHINFLFQNPLIGPNIRELGPKFPNLKNAYDKSLRDQLTSIANNLDVPLKDGVYLSWLGPTYETPAEIRMLKMLGADMVGMSTVPECIAANHLGVKVAGICFITNMAAGVTTSRNIDNQQIQSMAKGTMENFCKLLETIIVELHN